MLLFIINTTLGEIISADSFRIVGPMLSKHVDSLIGIVLQILH